MRYNLNIYYSSQLGKFLSVKGLNITGFEMAIVTGGVQSIPERLLDSIGRSLNWRPLDTVINNDNSISICINPSDEIFRGYQTVNLIHFSYTLNNFKKSGGDPFKYLGGSIYLTDPDTDQFVNIKDTVAGEVIYNLDPLNNIIKLPLNYTDNAFTPINCEFNCLGNIQISHYNSETYQMNSYYKQVGGSSFRDSKSVRYEINNHKITNDPIRNYNTMRMTPGGVTN